MASTSQCDYCRELRPSSQLKSCSGCSPLKKVRYCGEECQRNGWGLHKFQCDAGRKKLTTADHLERACCRDVIPADPQTLEDYGFQKLKDPEDACMLFGLYVGLLVHMQITSKKVHRWRTSGVLVREIKRRYEAVPEANRGEYYPWFLKNTYVLDPSAARGADSDRLDAPRDRSYIETWVQTGGSPTDSMKEIVSKIKEWPPEKIQCFEMYRLRNVGSYPRSDYNIWVLFGFCCTTLEGYVGLSALYSKLMDCCTFDEFYTAFSSCSLMQLFDKHGMGDLCRIQYPDLEDALSGFKSVWYLRQYVVAENMKACNQICVDYGFMNCRNDEEQRELKKLYTTLLLRCHVSPLQLHLACFEGRLFEFIDEKIPLEEEKELFTRLLMNPYPLPDRHILDAIIHKAIEEAPAASARGDLDAQSIIPKEEFRL